MVARQHYRWDFIGLSTDNKPTPATSEKVVDGSTFYCSDNSKLYVWYNDQWYEKVVSGGGGGGSYTAGDGIDITNAVISATNTGKAKVLTAADYNWPTTGTKTTVALWLLGPGIYYKTDSNVDVKLYNNTLGSVGVGDLCIVSDSGSYGRVVMVLSPGNANTFGRMGIVRANGTFTTSLNINRPFDNLTTSFAGNALDARQGKVLKDLVDSLAIRGEGAPTTSTVGEVGQLYEDGTNGALYQLKSIDITVTPNTYNWEQVGGGGEITELTSADYNYPSGSNPNGIAVWLLDDGVYKITDANTWFTNGEASDFRNFVIIVKKPTVASGTGDGTVVVFPEGGAAYIRDGYLTNGSGSTYYAISPSVVQTTGTSTTDVMSQNATTGMVFADPSFRTRVCIGQDAQVDINGGIAIGSTAVSRGQGIVIGGNSSTLGNSGVCIGAQASARGYGVSIGVAAKTTANGAIALGGWSAATQTGEMNIGSTNATYGYNNSNYRLLTGLYDPQSAHDAATKGYVDPTTDSSAPTSATAGRLGEIRIDTTTNTAYMCVLSDSATPAYEWKQITA